jgi:hypothetical protein
VSYYHAKRTALAKQYLEQREAQERIGPVDNRLERWRRWLDRYMAQPRRSNFDWRPRFAVTPPKEVDEYGQDIIEGEFTELADVASSSGAGDDSSGAGTPYQAIEPDATERAGSSEDRGEEAGWLEEAYPDRASAGSDTGLGDLTPF